VLVNVGVFVGVSAGVSVTVLVGVSVGVSVAVSTGGGIIQDPLSQKHAPLMYDGTPPLPHNPPALHEGQVGAALASLQTPQRARRASRNAQSVVANRLRA